MTDHPQTATERFLRHGVAGGWGNGRALIHRGGNYYAWSDHGDNVYDEMFSVGDALLDPALWRCAGKALGWAEEDQWHKTACTCAVPIHPMHDAHDDQCLRARCDRGWKFRWHGLLDWLAAHPGDVEAYLASLLDDDPLPHQEPCNCRDCSLTDTKDSK